MKNNNAFTIEWHSIVRDLYRNITIIIMAVIIGVLSSFVVQHKMYKPVYTSTATFVINAKVSNNASFSNLSVTSEMTKVLCTIFKQPSMKGKAADYLGKEFNGTIEANSLPGTNIMLLSVTSNDPQNSYEMLNAVLKVYPTISDKIFANAVLDIIKQPIIPHSPSNTYPNQYSTYIIFGSILAAIAAIIVLSVLRDTIKTEDAFKEKIDSEILGVIVHEKKPLKKKGKNKKKALLIHENAFTSLRFTEGFNKITAKLEYLHKRYGDKVFAVTSVAENEGKSTTASNIAISLAARGNTVLLVDLDEKKPSLYKVFELDFDEKSELGNLFEGKIQPKDFSFRHYKKSKLHLALNTKPHKNYLKWYENGTVNSVIESLKDKVDYIIIDTAPISVDAAVTNIVSFVDKTILVVRTDVVHTSAINDSILTIKEVGGNLAGCVLNDVFPEFTMFGQAGIDEDGYAYYGNYGRYNRYGKYGKYGSYGKYSSYSKYASYGKYNDDMTEVFENGSLDDDVTLLYNNESEGKA